jgi:hypothetical protein
VCLSRLGRRAEAFRYLTDSASGRFSKEDALLASVMQIQEGLFTAAEKSLKSMADKGDVRAKGLLARVPSLRTAYQSLEALGPSGDPVQRARLATFLGDAPRATPAWVEATASPAATKETLLEGIWSLGGASGRN